MGTTSSALHKGQWIHQIVGYFVFSVWVNLQLIVPFPRVAYLMLVCSVSHVRLFMVSWPAAHQASLSMGFSRQEYWSG